MKRLPLFLSILWFVAPTLLCAATGTIDSTNKYAWGSTLGWVNFSPTHGGVQITDTALSGYAWSQNFGWINLSPTFGGVTNSNGTLSGYAWSEKAGWINFTGVSINTSTGAFAGTASGSVAGTLTFNCANCNVQTSWRPASASSGGDSSGGGSVSFSFGGTGNFFGLQAPQIGQFSAPQILPVQHLPYSSSTPPRTQSWFSRPASSPVLSQTHSSLPTQVSAEQRPVSRAPLSWTTIGGIAGLILLAAIIIFIVR